MKNKMKRKFVNQRDTIKDTEHISQNTYAFCATVETHSNVQCTFNEPALLNKVLQGNLDSERMNG